MLFNLHNNVDIPSQYDSSSCICYLGSHKMKGAALMLFTVATRTRPVFHNAPDML